MTGIEAEKRGDRQQQRPKPDRDYTDVPSKVFDADDRVWHRNHGEHGPWYFDSSRDGRWNLQPDNGSLYLANSPEAAVRERIGTELDDASRVPFSVIAGRFVSTLRLPVDVCAVDLTFGDLLRWNVFASELASMEDYELTQEWAEQFFASGYTGIWARLRFSADDESKGLVVFGKEGPRDWDVDSERRAVADVLQEMGYVIRYPMDHRQATIQEPPKS